MCSINTCIAEFYNSHRANRKSFTMHLNFRQACSYSFAVSWIGCEKLIWYNRRVVINFITVYSQGNRRSLEYIYHRHRSKLELVFRNN